MSSDTPPSAVSNVRDNSLADNYQPHDISQAFVRGQLEDEGFVVEQMGTDDRFADEPRFGDGPDLSVHNGASEWTDPCGFIEVKAKRLSSDGDDWYGCLNERHLNEYLNVAAEEDAPVIIYMTVVDEDAEMVIREGFFDVTDCAVDHTRYAGGNDVVCLDLDTQQRNLSWVIDQFLNQ